MSLTPQSDFPVGCNRIAGCSFPSINGYPGTILHPPPPERLYKFGTPPRRSRRRRAAVRHYRALYIIILYSRRSRVRRRPSAYTYRSSPAPPLVVFHRLRGHVELERNGKTVSRHVLFYSFRKRNTHWRRRPRTNRLVSSCLVLYSCGWPCRRFPISGRFSLWHFCYSSAARLQRGDETRTTVARVCFL